MYWWMFSVCNKKRNKVNRFKLNCNIYKTVPQGALSLSSGILALKAPKACRKSIDAEWAHKLHILHNSKNEVPLCGGPIKSRRLAASSSRGRYSTPLTLQPVAVPVQSDPAPARKDWRPQHVAINHSSANVAVPPRQPINNSWQHIAFHQPFFSFL